VSFEAGRFRHHGAAHQSGLDARAPPARMIVKPRLTLATASKQTVGRRPPMATTQSSRGSDRAGLIAILNQFLASLPKHSPADVPLASNFKITEQAVRIPAGDGLWVSATSGPTAFNIQLADPVSGQAGFFGVIHEWDKPVLLATRLKVVSGMVIEIENVIARDLREASLANLKTPRPGLLADLPANEKTPRAEMIRIANSYFDSIEQDDGDLCPFADGCVRHENGLQTSLNNSPPPTGGIGEAFGPGVSAILAKLLALKTRDAMFSGGFAYITQIRPRHMVLCDEQKGIVYGFPRFVHRGDIRKMKISGVPGVEELPFGFGPNDLQAAEMFKIRSGKVYEIEASGFINAYLAPTGWDEEYPETYEYEVTHRRRWTRQPSRRSSQRSTSTA
jgi:hypothetical protein